MPFHKQLPHPARIGDVYEDLFAVQLNNACKAVQPADESCFYQVPQTYQRWLSCPRLITVNGSKPAPARQRMWYLGVHPNWVGCILFRACFRMMKGERLES